jgi:hypothetical protein
MWYVLVSKLCLSNQWSVNRESLYKRSGEGVMLLRLERNFFLSDARRRQGHGSRCHLPVWPFATNFEDHISETPLGYNLVISMSYVLGHDFTLQNLCLHLGSPLLQWQRILLAVLRHFQFAWSPLHVQGISGQANSPMHVSIIDDVSITSIAILLANFREHGARCAQSIFE